MSDFYAVLRQSIIDRGMTAPEEREEAYAQARRAMINRLWAYNPPLAEDEIDQRIGQFDMAVANIEDEVVEVFATMAEDAAHDQDAGYDPAAAPDGEDHDYPASFGGAPGEDEAEAEEPAGDEPAPRRSIDDTSRAVELALLAAEMPAPPSAHDEDLAGWSGEDEDFAEDDAEDADADDDAIAPPPGPDDRVTAAVAAAPTTIAKPQPKPKPKRAAAPLSARVRHLLPVTLPRSEQSRLRLLVGLVVVLSILLVGGIVWVLLARPTAPPATPVVLQTEVPGGVSDPDTAIRLPKEAIAVTTSFSLFDGQDPTVFESDPGNPVRFDGELARIATSSASSGAKVIIGAGLSSRLAGRTVRVTLDARSARENGATSMRFAYESGVAISHWQTANLASDFTELGLVWRVPALRTDPDGDYIVIEPGLPGSGTGVEIRSVRIDLVDQ